LVGDFRNAGRQWRPKDSPEEVRMHDFVIPELELRFPTAPTDFADHADWLSVSVGHDTAGPSRPTPSAVGRRLMGRKRGSRARLWKLALQKLADDLGVPITVWHLPRQAAREPQGHRATDRRRGDSIKVSDADIKVVNLTRQDFS
jgi:hypothetical protein